MIKVNVSSWSFDKPGHEKNILTSVIAYVGGLDADGTEYKGLGLGQDVKHSKIVALANDAGIDDVPDRFRKAVADKLFVE